MGLEHPLQCLVGGNVLFVQDVVSQPKQVFGRNFQGVVSDDCRVEDPVGSLFATGRRSHFVAIQIFDLEHAGTLFRRNPRVFAQIGDGLLRGVGGAGQIRLYLAVGRSDILRWKVRVGRDGIGGLR